MLDNTQSHLPRSRFGNGSTVRRAAGSTIGSASKSTARTNTRARCLVTAAAAFATAIVILAGTTPASAQTPTPERLNVLFLGDDGHHQPATRVVHIIPYMADRGINLFYTDRLEDLNSEKLAGYDVVAMYANHTHIAPAQETALLNYVADGGGFVPIHCASAMFGNSDAFISLVGGAFKSHGEGTFRTTITQPDHPAIRGVPTFESWDETYVHMKHNPDKNVLSVRVDGEHEEPWTWVRSYGDGRVFYTAWGHDERTWSQPGFHQLLEQGFRWAAGDWALAADLAPPEFEYMEGSAPNYPPDVGWGVTGDPITRLQEALSPEESMRQVVLEPGFRLELFAAEPDIVNPIDMAWDERGRLWVVETTDYPNEFEPERRGNDRIRILEDTDGDGRADTFTIFADSLNIPTSLTLSNGGVIVAQAPDMLYLKDTVGDDRAGVREVLFTGWGTFDTHAGPNNLRYGFDNRIWGTVGYSAFNGVVDGDSIRIPQGIFSFAPDGSKLESAAMTDNNTWGLGLSEDGMVFASTANGNPSTFMPIPSRYFTRLQGAYRHEEQDDVGADGNIPVLPTIADTPEFFPVTADVRQVDHHGRYTSGAGHEIYTARSFPREYWNRAAFVAEPTGHLLGRFFLEPDGSDFRAHNTWNMVAGRDAWFAPIQARVGPDGALWVIDWYNLIIQHNPTPPEHETGPGNAYVTPLRDRERSRIYRLVYEDAVDAARWSGRAGPSDSAASRDVAGVGDDGDSAIAFTSFSLADATAEDLLRALRDDNLHWRLTAQRLLVERGQTDVLPHLYRMVADVRINELGLSPGALHALWTIHGLGAFDGGNQDALHAASAALHHPSASVRRAALMVLPAGDEALNAILDAGFLPDRSAPGGMDYMIASEHMHASDPQVRLAALLALADMPPSERAGSAVAELALIPENANDRWISDAASIAGARHSSGFLQRMLRADLGDLRSDTSYVANLRRVVGTAAADYAAREPSGGLTAYSRELHEADPILAGAFVDGVAASRSDGDAPALTDEDRATLKSAFATGSSDLQERLRALADRWQLTDLFSEQD